MNHRSDLNDLKSRVHLAAVIRQAGLKLKPVGKNLMGPCPFHEDSTASLSVNGLLWNCFGCDAGGDLLDWLQLKEKLAFPQAVARLEELALKFPAEPSKPVKKASVPVPSLMGKVADRYHRRFLECPEAQDYLRSRGLDSKELWEAFRVGYCDGSMGPTIGEGSEQLQNIGLVNDKGREHFLGCLVVPLEHPDLGVVGFYGRKIKPDKVSHLYLPGPKRGVLHWQALKQAPRVVVAESVLDAFSLWMAGIRDVTCLFGANSWPADLDVLLHRYATPDVALCLDGDDAGQKATASYVQRLQNKGIRCSVISLPPHQDPNQVLVSQGPRALRELVEGATAVQAPAGPGREEREDGFVLTLGQVRYHLTLIGPFVGRLKCALVATREQRMFTDKLDLYLERTRLRCAAMLMRAMEITRTEAESHLNQIAREAMEWAELRKSGQPQKVRRQAPEMTPEDHEQGLEFLRQPNLVQAILDDCQALGFVGEEKSKLLAYLIGVSRKLPAPLSGVVISGSGAGKSTLARIVEKLVPPEDVLFYTRITPAALYYMCHDMRGLILMLEERAGGEGADYAIRALQSSNKLKMTLPVKDPATGQTTAQDIEVLGPIAYFETTTNPNINPENASRCFELFMDESPEQTARIHEQQRNRRLLFDYDPEELTAAVCAKHHNAQRLLRPMRVIIPYANHLQFPDQWVRTRRDNERFLCLVEAITFLHQYQREQGAHLGKPYVLATLDDYRLAYNLAREVLSSTLHELSHEAQELWQALVPFVIRKAPGNPLSFVFSFKDLRELTHSLSNYRLRTIMNELVELEYVTLLHGQNGKSFQFTLLTSDVARLPILTGLTTPDELEKRIKG